MVDVMLMQALMKATTDDAALLIVGARGLKPIFNSPVCEVAERQRQSAPCWRLGTTFSDSA